MTAGEPLLLLLLVGGALLLRATPAHQPPVAVAQWPVDHLCSEAGHHLVKMTRAEDGRDGGIYSSDSAGQTPSLASIYQVRQSSLYQVAIFGGCKSSLWRRNDKNRGQEAHQIILTVKMSALVFSRIEQVSTWAILVPNDLEEMRTEINTVYIYICT